PRFQHGSLVVCSLGPVPRPTATLSAPAVLVLGDHPHRLHSLWYLEASRGACTDYFIYFISKIPC
ncbi:MAG: hypothetical protein ACI90V_013502, partial [Bacillariaceae sp.]